MGEIDMRKVAFFLVVAFLSAFSSSAFAQATRTWVSGVGDDANPCSRTAPCKTFAGAISKTAAGGEINVLDPGGFGGVTITKSITIDGSGGSIAGVLVSGTNGMTINDSGAGTAVVTIRNIDFEGLGFSTASPGIKGISFVSGAVLHVQRCTIRDFRDAANGTGIAFTPSTSAKLFVEDTVLSGNGNNTVGGGIIIQPSGAATVKASLVRVNMENNVLGIRADGTGSTGGINVSITDSQSNGNAFAGITAFTPAASGASTKVMVNNTTVANNGTGLNANGANAILRVGNSVVFGNTTGVNIANSAVMTSYNNNQIDDNPTPGPTIPLTNPLK
jgi:hypothetical protein